jgi:uncharacterized membrane protein YfcA
VLEYYQSLEISSLSWFLFMLCGMLIGMSKAGVAGAGLMVVPLMAGIFGSRASVGILLPMLIAADVFAVIYYNRHANWRYVLLAMPWAIAGVIIGTIFGKSINDDQFSTVLAIIIIFGIVLMLWNDFRSRNISVPDHWWFAAILGLIGGFTTMVGNAAGPIMSLYLLSMRLPKNSFIGTAAWFFFIINVLKVPFHVFSWGTISIDTIKIDFAVLPAILIGVAAGIQIVKLFPEKGYRYFVIATTILAAVFLF